MGMVHEGRARQHAKKWDKFAAINDLFQQKKMIQFYTPEIAKGYAENRPYFHPCVIGRIKSYLNLSKKITMALDVGCGAGLSTIALLAIAERVIGVDTSQTMIRAAIKKAGVEYFNYPAEHLPFKQKLSLADISGT